MKTITLTPDASGMVDWPTLSNDKKSVVTIGSFDGMHQGHQAVIRRVVELARRNSPSPWWCCSIHAQRSCTATRRKTVARSRRQA